MKGIQDMMAGALGITPDIMQQVALFVSHMQTVFTDMQQRQRSIDNQLETISATLYRVEQNTLFLIENSDGLVSAAPTNYAELPLMQSLPPMENEVQNER